MPPTETKTIRRPRLEKAVELLWWAIVASGIGIRLGAYWYNRSLRNGHKRTSFLPSGLFVRMSPTRHGTDSVLNNCAWDVFLFNCK